MNWLQLRLETRAELVGACEDALLELGAAAVTLEDNADEPLFAGADGDGPVWQLTRVTGLFPADTDIEALSGALPEALRRDCEWRAELLEDKDWEREWMSNYQPQQLGEHLWLCPSWQTPPDPRATNILLDPGLAFGTGTHPTTAMCLEALAKLDLNGKQVIDYGCGSGVLAVAALRLGASRATAVDIDPQALVATRSNAELNGIEAGRLDVGLPGSLQGDERADLVIANILAGPLGELAERLCQMLRPGAILLLSGILVEQVEDLRQHYPLPLTLANEREGWALLEGSA